MTPFVVVAVVLVVVVAATALVYSRQRRSDTHDLEATRRVVAGGPGTADAGGTGGGG